MNGSTTVTVVQVTTTRSPLGAETYETLEQDVVDVMVAPGAPSERPDDKGNPRTVLSASFYLPIPLQLNADDLILHAGHEWRVEGGSQVWVDQTEVSAIRAGAYG